MRLERARSRRTLAVWALALGALGPLARESAAQRPSALALIGPGGAAGVAIPIGYQRGYAAVPVGALARIGWTVATTARGAEARRANDRIELVEKSPYFHWSDTVLQLAGEPYRYGDDLWVPLQLLSDFLPQRRAQEYAFHADQSALEVKMAAAWTPEIAERLARESAAPAKVAAPRGDLPAAARPRVTTPGPASTAPRPRVVIIDPGHGGEDPGARGPRGVREKDVALRIGQALAHELEKHPDLEVHLTRAQDRLVPLWERGAWATGVKGERAGVFISLHANSGPSLSARGFETYFLSEARTEHERRVAALENEPFRENAGGPASSELGGIVLELRNLDHQHWSSVLAELVQEEMGRVHPGPNRGVKQAPLAVITNALMPAVLVEVGFISNRDEERLLDGAAFQADAARAIAKAVLRFFDGYPPGGAPQDGDRR
ncbi:MAG: N-acetylmuramoyl-L-alanine amidase [Gemmatimonadetes bacterium]|nr:N-acetylmuramoyl-L-alanine amidase [Gemmatimonadota bacterium]